MPSALALDGWSGSYAIAHALAQYVLAYSRARVRSPVFFGLGLAPVIFLGRDPFKKGGKYARVVPLRVRQSLAYSG
jgi:hypothetical protein